MRTGAPLAELDAASGGLPRTAESFHEDESAVPTAGGYRLRSILRRSGAVTVREAVKGGRRYALKLASTGDPALDRLRAEYRLGAALSHASIIAPVSWLDTAAAAGIVFDYLPGGDLVSLAGAAAQHWARPVAAIARALGYLHDRGLVHRDVKARNVMFDAAGHALLIDLGSCQPSGSAWRVGGTTPEHRRPGRPVAVGPRDDVYAFAVLVRELLGGGGRPRPDAPAEAAELEQIVAETLATGGDAPTEKLRRFESALESLSAAKIYL